MLNKYEATLARRLRENLTWVIDNFKHVVIIRNLYCIRHGKDFNHPEYWTSHNENISASIQFNHYFRFPNKKEKIEYLITILRILRDNDKVTTEQYRSFKGQIEKFDVDPLMNWFHTNGIGKYAKRYYRYTRSKIRVTKAIIDMPQNTPEQDAIDMMYKYLAIEQYQHHFPNMFSAKETGLDPEPDLERGNTASYLSFDEFMTGMKDFYNKKNDGGGMIEI